MVWPDVDIVRFKKECVEELDYWTTYYDLGQKIYFTSDETPDWEEKTFNY